MHAEVSAVRIAPIEYPVLSFACQRGPTSLPAPEIDMEPLFPQKRVGSRSVAELFGDIPELPHRPHIE